MRVEIFVVTTELEAKHDINGKTRLEDLRTEIIRIFGGLTETNPEIGYWSDNGEIYQDAVKRWIIYTDLTYTHEIIEGFAKRIKTLTSQKSQAYGIDGKMFYV